MAQPNPSALIDAQLAELRAAAIGATIVHAKSGAGPSGAVDRFTLRIPYCKSSLKWRIILNREQLSVAPDFLLGRGEENAIDISLLKTIRGWDIRNPKALSEIVSEMLATYREAQKRAVLAYPLERIHFEVSLIQDRVGAEFLLTQSPEHGAEIRVVLPLDIPEAWSPGQRADNSKVSLFVAWRPAVRDTPTTSLVTGAHFDNILGEVQLPQWRAEMCLMDFIPAVEAAVKEGISDFAHRKAFVQQCLVMLGSPLEYDSAGFRKISFLLGDEKPRKDDKDLLMIAIISLPLNFQKDKPAIVLQSVMPGRGGKPIARAATNFPWTPKTPAEEAIRKLKAYFAEVRVDFALVVEAELKQLAGES